MLEKVVEQHLVQKVKSLGGVCYKLAPEYCAGIPDRIVLYDKNIYLVELKQPKGNLSPIQILRHKEINKAGVNVYVLKSISDVDNFLQKITKEENDTSSPNEKK